VSFIGASRVHAHLSGACCHTINISATSQQALFSGNGHPKSRLPD
jgi:hypothetical protein